MLYKKINENVEKELKKVRDEAENKERSLGDRLIEAMSTAQRNKEEYEKQIEGLTTSNE